MKSGDLTWDESQSTEGGDYDNNQTLSSRFDEKEAANMLVCNINTVFIKSEIYFIKNVHC